MASVRGDEQVESMLADLTLEEKLSLIRGAADPAGEATGYIPGVPRLDIPPLSLVDGPMGIRDGIATAFPATLALGASWDTDLARRMGRALAAEARAKDHHVLLGPGVNLVRVPTAGRNFEYLSEDPHLAGGVGAGYVRGVQSGDVLATPKHYVVNNQETARARISVDVGERPMRELYLRPFERTVEADAAAIMAAYNRVDGEHMTEHDRLLEDVLKEDLDFDGAVVSDWWATHEGAAAINAGLDVEMPGVTVLRWFAPNSAVLQAVNAVGLSRRLGIQPTIARRVYERFLANPGMPNPFDAGHFGDPLVRAKENGHLEEGALDDAVGRVLSLYDCLDLLDGEGSDAPADTDQLDGVAHADLAREIARRGTVILQNDGALPLDSGDAIALIGSNADEAKVGGGGSSEVEPPTTVSPLEAFESRVDGHLRFERGVPRIEQPSMFSMPWHVSLADLAPGPSLDDAVDAAADADVAVVVVQDGATEGADRETMALPGAQDRLVEAVADATAKTVVVVRTSGPVEMPWLDDVNAVLATWYSGQQDGEALADVLFGVDPGGHLPVTFGETFEDYPVASERRYPGVDGTVHYDEGVFAGYRHFDREGIDPLFPFGHGLSFADFAFEDIDIEDGGSNGDLTATVTVTNESDRPGRTVAQAYVEPRDAPVPRPPRELAGFEPIALDGGESTTVALPLAERAFARYDAGEREWIVDPGEYGIAVGPASRDARVRSTVDR